MYLAPITLLLTHLASLLCICCSTSFSSQILYFVDNVRLKRTGSFYAFVWSFSFVVVKSFLLNRVGLLRLALGTRPNKFEVT